jgi:osmotically-inducible protein OsmY
MAKTDMQLKKDVEDELEWDPKVNAARVGVTVSSGVVTLAGDVDTYAEKAAAEAAAKRVSGVRSVAEDLIVKVPGFHMRTDTDIAAAAQSALTWDVWVPKTVTLTVRQGRITLRGEVQWKYQSDSATEAVRNLPGVVGVSNEITVKPGVSASQVEEKVRAALQRQATADAKSIHIATAGSTVTLSGDASSLKAADDAAVAAWSAPGVTAVIDNLRVSGP